MTVIAIARRMIWGSVAIRIATPSGTVMQAAARMTPITRQRTRRCVCTSIGEATIDSSSSTTATVTCEPSSSASGGDITSAPPKPVIPRTTPAMPAIATAALSVKKSKRQPLGRNHHVSARDADARVADVRASREEADELGERGGAKAALGRRIAQRLDQLAIVERREQHVFIARRRSELLAAFYDRKLIEPL